MGPLRDAPAGGRRRSGRAASCSRRRSPRQEFRRELFEPTRLPPAPPAGRVPRTPPDSAPMERPAPCEFEEQDIMASLNLPPTAEASGRRTDRRGHFPRWDPRHAGPRFLHADGTAASASASSSGTAGWGAPTTGRTSARGAALLGTPPRRVRPLRAPCPLRSRSPASPTRGPSGAHKATHAPRVILTARRRCRGGLLGTTGKRGSPRVFFTNYVSFRSLPPRRRFSYVMCLIVCIYTCRGLPHVAAPARYRPQADAARGSEPRTAPVLRS